METRPVDLAPKPAKKHSSPDAQDKQGTIQVRAEDVATSPTTQWDLALVAFSP
jgi:hypothetical protein